MEITDKQRLMGHGAMLLIKTHYEKTKEYVEILKVLVGEKENDYFFVEDFVYGDECFDFDKLIEKEGIKVLSTEDE